MKKVRKLSKKFSAGLLGVTLLASSVAAQNLGNLPQPLVDDEGNMAADIVVGQDAKPVDVVSAIDIAGTFGNDAYSTAQKVVESGEATNVEGVTSDVSIRGGISPGLTIDRSDYSSLLRTNIEDHYVIEEVDVSDSSVNTVTVNDTVETTVNQDALKYSVHYNPAFEVDDKIPLLGENYTIIGTGSNSVDLGSTQDENGLELGSSFEHGPYTVEVVDKNEQNSEIFVEVRKDGEFVDDQALANGDTMTIEDGLLTLEADNVFFGSQRDYIDLTSTYSEYTLEEGETSDIAPDYTASITFESGDVSKVELSNQVKAVNKKAENLNENEIESLEAGESFEGPSGYFTLSNLGITEEETEPISFGEEYQVEYTDVEGFEQNLDIRNVISAEGSGSLTTTNPWSGETDTVAFYDATGSDEWDATADLIVEDYNNGGTISTGADTELNTGSDSTADTSSGETYEDISNIDASYYLVDSDDDSAFDAGEDIVTDDDNDNQYTERADQVIDIDGISSTDTYGMTPDAAEGADLTGAETISVAAGTLPGGSGGLYYVDSDNSGGYSSSDEIVLDPNIGSAGSLTLDTDAGTDSDSDGVAGDDTIISIGSDVTDNSANGDTLQQFSSTDHIAFEDDGITGASTNNGAYDDGEDIVVDYQDGQTLSTSPDSMINDGGTDNSAEGDALTQLNGVTAPTNIVWNDVDDNSAYDTGDEILVDNDEDGQYTSQADNKIAGNQAVGDLTAGDDLTTTNPWSGVSSPVSFIDAASGDNWDSNADLIAVDEDDNGFYDSSTDTQLAGTEPTGSTGLFEVGSDKEVVTDVSGHPIDVDYSDADSEVTVSYETFEQIVTPSDSGSTYETGYGFSVTVDYEDTDSDGTDEIDITGSDSVLNSQFGAEIQQDGSNIDVEEDADDSFDDLTVSYDGNNQVETIDSADFSSSSSEIETITNYGTLVDFEPEGSASFTYPENQLFSQHAVGEVSTSESSDQIYTERMPTGVSDVAALDTEASANQNLILVGGPLVNDLTSTLAEQGDSWTADEYVAGEGLIQLVDGAFNGYDALVVAGQSGEDTRAAGEYLSDYQENIEDLEGKSQVRIDTETGEIAE